MENIKVNIIGSPGRISTLTQHTDTLKDSYEVGHKVILKLSADGEEDNWKESEGGIKLATLVGFDFSHQLQLDVDHLYTPNIENDVLLSSIVAFDRIKRLFKFEELK